MFSQTVEYAFRAMVNLAALDPERSASSEAIAARTSVPPSYLSKVLRDLVRAGLVVSQRGPNGGFALARAPREISLLDVVAAVDPIRRIVECPLGNPDHVRLCPLHARLDRSLDQIECEFRATTLAEILEGSGRGLGSCRSLVGRRAGPPAGRPGSARPPSASPRRSGS